jgi:uncharacterized membrane protein YfcA
LLGKTLLIGFLAGYFSGHFGLGGGLITTPAIRLILNQPPFIAEGTPLIVNIPTALLGAYNYNKKGFLRKNLVLPLAAGGSAGAFLGAALTKLFSGSLVLFLTAIAIFFVGLRFVFSPTPKTKIKKELTFPALIFAGALIGVFSGFLGLGGGFLLVPFLSLFLGLDMKTTFGTSLAVILLITVPGATVHFFLGHINLKLGLLLSLGVLPGAYLGSTVAMRLPNPWLKVSFGCFLMLTAAYLAKSLL